MPPIKEHHLAVDKKQAMFFSARIDQHITEIIRLPLNTTSCILNMDVLMYFKKAHTNFSHP